MGQQVGTGKTSLVFRLYVQSDDQTLTDEEVDAAFADILDADERQLHAELRA